MSKRAYTVVEIDALRSAVEMRWLFGTTAWSGSVASRCYTEADKIKAVEEMTRTYMLAGITAHDLIEQDKVKATP